MQVTHTSFTNTDIQTTRISKEKNPRIKSYLQSLNWNTTMFTNQKLEAILAASCLRFLEDLEEITFVLRLAKEISAKYGNSAKLSLHYSTEIINGLAIKLKTNEIKSSDSKRIKDIVNEAQEVITGIIY